jgi:hypothetical protein
VSGQGDLFADVPSPALVPVYPEPAGPAPEPLSYGRRLTQRKREMPARGVHPVTGCRLLPEADGKRCGDCAHLRRWDRFVKCALNDTRGAATDTRVRWPACSQFVAGGEGEADRGG